MSKKYTVNQGFMSLSTYYLEDGCHLARLHRRRRRRPRRRAYAPTSNTASHDNQNEKKINSRVPLVSYMGMGSRSRRSSAKIQRVQMCVIFMKSKYCHITLLLKELHWLPVTFRIQFKVILITFKVVHDMAPSHISGLLRVRQNTKYSFRSNNKILLTPPLKKSAATTGDRSSTMAAPILWNSLPLESRNIHKLDKFKSFNQQH